MKVRGALLHALLMTGAVVICYELSDCTVDFLEDVEEGYTTMCGSADVGAKDKAAFDDSVRFSP